MNNKPKFTTHNPYSSIESGCIMPKHKKANEPDVVRLRVRNTDDGVEKHAPSKSKPFYFCINCDRSHYAETKIGQAHKAWMLK